jgi:F-type H+-transporting ATPase subunit a
VPTDEPKPDITEVDASAAATPEAGPRRFGIRSLIVAALLIVVVLDVIAFVFFYPANPDNPAEPCAFPVCFIHGTLEFPAPEVLVGPQPPAGGLVITFQPSITNTMFTMWIVSVGLLGAIWLLSRGGPGVPGRLQNVGEWTYESLSNFGTSIGGAPALRYIPIFAAFFLLILFSNWVGLVPIAGKVNYLRAPTSDVNVTLGLALVSFFIFEFEGFRRLGGRAYLSKFFPFYEFRKGIGAGLIAMFVGLVELMLDFVRPLTLSMRLFGNIYGGEVALGVITALTLVFLPILLLTLEFMLNFIQALIFSILSLMYIVLAIESHDHEEGHVAEEAVAVAEGHVPAARTAAPAH